jgi:hypothetical protein
METKSEENKKSGIVPAPECKQSKEGVLLSFFGLYRLIV